jgi:hypothetical protein
MKILSYILTLMVITSIFSCKKDNYAAPDSKLIGALMYKGDSIGVEYSRVPFQLYQNGFGKVGAINETFDQAGVMHALLFDGQYKFIIPNGKGPFLWKQTASGDPDTLSITVKGNQNINIEVNPYYMIRNSKITGSGTNISANCKIEKIITDSINAKNIDRITLYINKTQFVSGADNIASTTILGSGITDPNNISLSLTVPAIVPTQNYIFARIGIKIAGVENLLFSPLQKIQL